MSRRSMWWVVVAVLAAVVMGAAGGTVYARRQAGSERYLELLQRADQLWRDYKSADREFFSRDRPDVVAHVSELARVQDELAELHEEWMGIEVPDELAVTDLKVGLALELQMAAIGAEIVGVLDDDRDYLDLSASLDEGYEGVVDDL